MAWPSTLYVGTASLGVYRCTDFLTPSTQPTWATYNAGLANTLLQWFGMDPYDSTILYCLLTDGGFYRKVGAADWALLYTAAQVQTLVGVEAGRFYHCCCDPLTEGTLYAMFHPGVTNSTQALCRSTDRGASWSVFRELYAGAYSYNWGCVSARGDHVQCAHASYPTGGGYLSMTDDAGGTWQTNSFAGESVPDNRGQLHPLNSAVGYWTYFVSGPAGGSWQMKRMSIAARTVLQSGTLTHSGHDQAVWFSPTDADHMRALHEGTLRETEDDWSTVADTANLGFTAGAMIGPDPGDSDKMLLGAYRYEVAPDLLSGHTVAALVGMAGSPVGISGANVGSSPYTDSISPQSGGVCLGGLQYVRTVAGRWYLHGCAYTEVTP